MGRLLGGLLAAFVLTFWVTSTAHAAEIPPTAECQATFKTLLDAAIKTDPGTKKQGKRALRKLTQDLEDAGCISDAEPLFRKVAVMPFSDECVDAATRAQAVFAPQTKRLKALTKPYQTKVVRPYLHRMFALTNRISRLHKQGPSRELTIAKRELRRLNKQFRVKSQKFYSQVRSEVSLNPYGTILIFWEFYSRRCISDAEAKGPVAKVLRNNTGLILFSIFSIDPGDGYGNSSSKQPAAGALLPAGMTP